MAKTVVIPRILGFPERARKILGVSLFDRILIPSKMSGFENFLLSGSEEIPGLPSAEFDEFVVLFPHIILTQESWRKLMRLECALETIYCSAQTDSLFVVRTKHQSDIFYILSGCHTPSEIVQKLKKTLRVQNLPLENGAWTSLRNESELMSAERWLLQGLRKESEGVMSRHLERKISLAVTKQLAHHSITPNTMTGVSAGVGIAGAILFLSAETAFHVTGAFLFWLHSILDGCDGELARLKFSESRAGGILDFWSDNIVHASVFGAIALGLQIRSENALPALLGLSAVSGTLLSAGLVYRSTMRRPQPQSESGPLFTSVVSHLPSCPAGPGATLRLQKALDYLARRDFIYLVILLAIFGKIEWFLWLGAVGAPIYFLVLAGVIFLHKK